MISEFFNSIDESEEKSSEVKRVKSENEKGLEEGKPQKDIDGLKKEEKATKEGRRSKESHFDESKIRKSKPEKKGERSEETLNDKNKDSKEVHTKKHKNIHDEGVTDNHVGESKLRKHSHDNNKEIVNIHSKENNAEKDGTKDKASHFKDEKLKKFEPEPEDHIRQDPADSHSDQSKIRTYKTKKEEEKSEEKSDQGKEAQDDKSSHIKEDHHSKTHRNGGNGKVERGISSSASEGVGIWDWIWFGS